jgi:hypothetical protein
MDLVAKDLPILESKELTKRVRKQMITQGIVEPTDEEIKELGLDQEQQPDPQQVAVTDNINMQTEDLISKIEERDAKTLQTTVKTQQATIDSYKTLIDAYKDQLDAGIPLTQADHSVRIKQRDVIVEGQQALEGGPNSEEINDIVQGAAVTGAQLDQPGNARRLTVEAPSASVGQDNL